ncbi:MAG: hypothetical protein Q8Q73_01045 [Stagnimonas sp.]|nr:hypothetical protein [Stagnimonas sp.]
MSFETTVDVRLQPSLRLLKWVSTLHILPLATLPFAMQPGPAMWALIAGFGGSWLWLRRHPALGFGNQALLRLTWNADGSWTVSDARGQPQAATLQDDSLRHARLLVLRFRLASGGTRTRLIAGDEADPELLRRLRARLSVAA